MGLCRFKPEPSSRMGIIWTLSTIKEAVIIEFGCMGHMLYNSTTLERSGVWDGGKIYTTHIDETDIAFGESKKLELSIEKLIEEQDPKAVFVVPSSIPEITGMDIEYTCDSIQRKYQDTPIIYFDSGGFSLSQSKAIDKTLLKLVKSLSKDLDKSEAKTYNIIGSCPDIYNFNEDCKEICRIVEGVFGLEKNTVLTSDTSVSDIEQIARGHINLVIREEGLATAKYLESEYNIPYIYSRHYGIESNKKWLDDLGDMLKIEKNEEFLNRELDRLYKQLRIAMPTIIHHTRAHVDESIVHIGGHTDVVRGLSSFLFDELGFTKGRLWSDSKYAPDESIPYLIEEDWVDIVESMDREILMASGEVLSHYGRNERLQIASPNTKWIVHDYDPPLVGFRGAINIINILINEIAD